MDEVYLTLIPSMTVAIFYGSHLAEGARSQKLLFSEILNSDEGAKSIYDLNLVMEEYLEVDS